MKTSTKISTIAETPAINIPDAQRTIRIPGAIDIALLQLQAERRLQGKKCPAVNGLILEAIEKLLFEEAPHLLRQP